MKQGALFFFILLPMFARAQETIKAGVYRWPTFNSGKSNTSTMLSGSAFDLSALNVSAHLLNDKKKTLVQVPKTEEQLILVKSGTLSITIKDSIYHLVKGSIAMMLPGEKFWLQNNQSEPCEFHVMKYTSRLRADPGRGDASGGSFVQDWNKLTFKAHERGGVRSYFDRATAMTKRFEMHVTTLKENFKSHDPHQHRAEEFILVLEGSVKMLIGDNYYQASAGDLLFAPTGVLHGLQNNGTGNCSYYAFQWE